MTTKNYKKMCEKATEMQRAWRPEDMDFFCYTKSREIGQACIDNKRRTQEEWTENLKYQFWLPTQEQLQDIGSLMCNFPCQVLTFLNGWIKENNVHLSEYKSMEELWLSYVMKERWNKKWTGDNWILC